MRLAMDRIQEATSGVELWTTRCSAVAESVREFVQRVCKADFRLPIASLTVLERLLERAVAVVCPPFHTAIHWLR